MGIVEPAAPLGHLHPPATATHTRARIHTHAHARTHCPPPPTRHHTHMDTHTRTHGRTDTRTHGHTVSCRRASGPTDASPTHTLCPAPQLAPLPCCRMCPRPEEVYQAVTHGDQVAAADCAQGPEGRGPRGRGCRQAVGAPRQAQERAWIHAHGPARGAGWGAGGRQRVQHHDMTPRRQSFV